jgi:hypothetical protein
MHPEVPKSINTNIKESTMNIKDAAANSKSSNSITDGYSAINNSSTNATDEDAATEQSITNIVNPKPDDRTSTNDTINTKLDLKHTGSNTEESIPETTEQPATINSISSLPLRKCKEFLQMKMLSILTEVVSINDSQRMASR